MGRHNGGVLLALERFRKHGVRVIMIDDNYDSAVDDDDIVGIKTWYNERYVKDGSKLDKEAIKRGTSVYMFDRVIPMLPFELSNGICSLNAGEDRFTLSCSMEIDSKGKTISVEVYKGIINVTERMNYHDVQKILDKSDEKVLKRYEKYINDFEHTIMYDF